MAFFTVTIAQPKNMSACFRTIFSSQAYAAFRSKILERNGLRNRNGPSRFGTPLAVPESNITPQFRNCPEGWLSAVSDLVCPQRLFRSQGRYTAIVQELVDCNDIPSDVIIMQNYTQHFGPEGDPLVNGMVQVTRSMKSIVKVNAASFTVSS